MAGRMPSRSADAHSCSVYVFGVPDFGFHILSLYVGWGKRESRQKEGRADFTPLRVHLAMASSPAHSNYQLNSLLFHLSYGLDNLAFQKLGNTTKK